MVYFWYRAMASTLDSKVLSLWGIDKNTSLDVIKAVQFLSTQHSRTSSSDAVNLQTLIHAMNETNDNEQSIEYINYEDVSDYDFSIRFSEKLLPCMIRNCCEKDNWRARDRWRTVDELKSWYGDVPIRITEMKSHPAAKSEPLRIPLSNYLAYCSNDSGGADFPWYGFDDNFR